MSAVRVAASTTMWATVMGSSEPAAAGSTCHWVTGDRGDSSPRLQSSGLCPCRMAGVGPLISPNGPLL